MTVSRRKLKSSRNLLRLVALGYVVLALAGLFSIDPYAYLLVLTAAALPIAFWVRAGAIGIPVFPIIAALYYLFYALPILRNHVLFFTNAEIDYAAETVAIFLVCATAAFALVTRNVTSRRLVREGTVFLDRHVPRLILVGLGFGALFNILMMIGAFDSVGPYIEVIRSFALTLASVSAYLMGYARARRLLSSTRWMQAVALLGIITIASVVSLFLIGVVTIMACVFLGYIVAVRRIPWVTILCSVAVLGVLHAGKGEMRAKYWGTYTANQITVTDAPEVLYHWFRVGLDNIIADDQAGGQSIVDRASLLHMVMRVQRKTPDEIPYFEGETYELFPKMIVPRVFNPDKVVSQRALQILSIRYGLQNEESARSTTIGWGLVAEAYANFGLLGVICIGVLYGLMTGGLMRWSAFSSTLSIPNLITIAATANFVNIEADLSYMLTNLAHTVFGAAIGFAALRFMKIYRTGRRTRKRGRPSRLPAGLEHGPAAPNEGAAE